MYDSKNHHTIVNHGFVDGVSGLVREDACGEAWDDLFDIKLFSQRKDIVVDGHVNSEKFEVGSHITVESSDFSSKVENVGWSVFFKDLKKFSPTDFFTVLVIIYFISAIFLCNLLMLKTKKFIIDQSRHRSNENILQKISLSFFVEISENNFEIHLWGSRSHRVRLLTLVEFWVFWNFGRQFGSLSKILTY